MDYLGGDELFSAPVAARLRQMIAARRWTPPSPAESTFPRPVKSPNSVPFFPPLHDRGARQRGPAGRPTLAVLRRPLLSSPLPPALLGPSSRPRSLPPRLPSLPPWEPVCPCWTDTVAIRAEQSWRPGYRQRPVLTHPGPANGASVRIPQLLGGAFYGYKPWRRRRIYLSVEEGPGGDPFRVSVDSTQPPFC